MFPKGVCMLFAGIQILGEFLEQRIKEHFERLRQKQRELGVKLPPFPKPVFTGSTKTVHTLKTKPGSKGGDNVLLIHFDSARISNYTFDSIQCQLHFKFYIGVTHFTVLSDITDTIMLLHNAPVNIEEHENVFTEKGYVKPQIYILNTRINNVVCINSIEKPFNYDAFKYVMNVTFDMRISWPPNLKL